MQEWEPKNHQSNGQVTDVETPGGSVSLPRMPLGLRLVSGKPLYAALAGICRTLGRLAAYQGISLHASAPIFSYSETPHEAADLMAHSNCERQALHYQAHYCIHLL